VAAAKSWEPAPGHREGSGHRPRRRAVDVRTGEKQRVYAMAAIGTAIAEMAARRRDLAGQRASEFNIRRPD